VTIPIEEVATKVIVPLVAAFAGAFTAQHFADRNRRREEILKEIRSTNAAISLACAVCQVGMRLKKQHIRDLLNDFEKSRAAFIEGHRRNADGLSEPAEAVRIEFNLRTLHPPKLDAAILRAHVLERVNISGRGLHAAIEIDDVATTLTDVMAQRNVQVKELQAEQMRLISEGRSVAATAPRYFGLPTPQGCDERYVSLLQGIGESTDNVIFFSYQLCLDLQEHGKILTTRYPRRWTFFRDNRVPRIQTMDFTQPLADGMVPTGQIFKEWLAAFSTYPQPPSMWQWLRHPISSWRRSRA